MRIVPLSMQLPRALQALNKSIKYMVTAWAGIVSEEWQTTSFCPALC